MTTNKRGNCYVSCEALYHLLGGKQTGWKPMNMQWEGDSHWYLQHSSGIILDPTKQQFKKTPDYTKGRGRGFLTSKPSKRARQLMKLIVWQ